MTTHETQGQGEWPTNLTDKELIAAGRSTQAAIKRADQAASELRQKRLQIADELHRVRGLFKVARMAEDVFGIRFQALRPQLEKFWADRGIDYSPDHRPVLIDRDRENIRLRYRTGGRGNAMHSIAKDYGIAPATVRDIVRGVIPGTRVDPDTQKEAVKKKLDALKGDSDQAIADRLRAASAESVDA
jgi:hypothetical protein